MRLLAAIHRKKARALMKLHITLVPLAIQFMVGLEAFCQEPFNRVAIEAMAAGKPMIASNVGGLKDIIKKDFGCLVEPEDAEGWQGAIELLLNKPIKRKLMGLMQQDTK